VEKSFIRVNGGYFFLLALRWEIFHSITTTKKGKKCRNSKHSIFHFYIIRILIKTTRGYERCLVNILKISSCFLCVQKTYTRNNDHNSTPKYVDFGAQTRNVNFLTRFFIRKVLAQNKIQLTRHIMVFYIVSLP
jgi:hypothetical protein